MIFSNKIYKIASGKNVSLFSEDENTMTMYLLNDKISKRKIIFSEILRCIKASTSIEGMYVKKINDEQICVCQDDFMTVTNETN